VYNIFDCKKSTLKEWIDIYKTTKNIKKNWFFKNILYILKNLVYFKSLKYILKIKMASFNENNTNSTTNNHKDNKNSIIKIDKENGDKDNINEDNDNNFPENESECLKMVNDKNEEPVKLCENMDCERYPDDWDFEEDTEDTYQEDQWKKCCLCDGYFNDNGMGYNWWK